MKKKKRKSSMVVGGELFTGGKWTEEYRSRTTGILHKQTLTRRHALELLKEDTEENYPPEEGW